MKEIKHKLKCSFIIISFYWLEKGETAAKMISSQNIAFKPNKLILSDFVSNIQKYLFE